MTVCLQGKEGLVVASDSRGTFGDPRGVTAQNDTIKKVYLVKNVGILQAGSQQGNMIVEELEKLSQIEELSGVTKAMQKVREIAKKRFDEWFSTFPLFPAPNQNPQFMRPTLQLSVAGYDDDGVKKIPRMYSMVSNYDFAPNLHDFGFALLGVAQYALYLLNRLYSTDINITGLKHLAAYVITETAAQDGKVGGPVQMGVIFPNQNAQMLNDDEIGSIIVENEKRSKELKGLFR